MGRRSVYVLCLVDHHSSMVWCIQLPNKQSATVQQALAEWLAYVERWAGVKLVTLRSDNGSEFQGEVDLWLRSLGVQRQFSAPYSPQQNGKVERWSRDHD